MRLSLLLIILLILGCSPKSPLPSLALQVKRLEYNRSSNLNQWKNLYQNATTSGNRLMILSAMSKTGNDSFIPFYLNVLKNSSGEELTKQALFALGELHTKSAGEALLSLSYESLTTPSKSIFLWALANSCPKKGPDFLRKLADRGETDDSFWKAMALCSRKKVAQSLNRQLLADSSFYADLDLRKSYFLLYAAEPKNLPALLNLLKDGRGLSQKYLLKTLSRMYQAQPTVFLKKLQKDSSLANPFYNKLAQLLNTRLPWQNKFYAIRLAPLAGDSLVSKKLLQLTNDDNIHLQIEAFKALTVLNDSLAAEAILNRFSHIKNNFLKGSCLIQLAKIRPKKAYRLTAQELDKGDVYYKGLLLQALGNISFGLATETLRQFLQVPDSYLNVKAFEVLDRIHKLRKKDVNLMLHSSSLSCVYTALEWNQRKQRKIGKKTLLELFTKFNQIADFELQKALLDAYKQGGYLPDSSAKKLILANAAHPVLLKSLPKSLLPQTKKVDLLQYLPPYLTPDSVLSARPDRYVTLNTSKGKIQIELFYKQAPLTCKNFITLARRHFYDNLSFHRVIPDFVVQGGDPSGDGFGGPGYMIPSEHSMMPFKRGSVGMATAGFDTGGSQFFICHSEQPHLDGNYTLFGHVNHGMEIVDRLVPGDKIISVVISNEP